MRHLLLLLSLILLTFLAQAHPGIGIVRDSKGNIYYTDLIHVWRITPEGEKSIVVREVHTHELSLDKNDNLYGEDLRYTGETDNRWFHSIWKRTRIGEVSSIERARPGFRNDYGFAHDSFGNQYWIYHETESTTIRRRTIGGTVSTLTPDQDLGIINWVSVTDDGKTIFLASSRALYKMTQTGHVETLLKDDNRGRHTLMGMSVLKDGSLYVADFGQQAVKKISKDGTVTIPIKTADPWSPSGVCAAPDGTLWVLEYSDRNEARVRRIGPDGKVKVY
jgi:dipeptidyl aminopeptidase/acylaminoacyl peptidase